MENNRQVMNRLILKKLSEMVERYPDQRFGQLISNLCLDHIPYHEESYVTFSTLLANIEAIQSFERLEKKDGK